MARCSGCSGAAVGCNCVTDGLSITGTGSTGDPFEVNPAALTDIAPFSKDGVQTVYTGKLRFRFPFEATIIGVSGALNTAPTGDDFIFDVMKAGVSIFPISTKPTILDGTNDTGVSEFVPDNTGINPGDYLTIDILQVGSVIAGSDFTAFIHYRLML